MNDSFWCSFSCDGNLVVCGPAGCAVYSPSDLGRPLCAPVTRFGGVACAALYQRLLALVGRAHTAGPALAPEGAPNLGVARAEAADAEEDGVRNHGPRCVRLVNAESQRALAELCFPTAVCGVGLNARHLVVVLEGRTLLYGVHALVRAARTLRNSGGGECPIVNARGPHECRPVAVVATPQLNGDGVFALSCGQGAPSVLALPGETPGAVVVYDADAGTTRVVERVHGHAVTALALSRDARVLASCSEDGKTIKLVSLDADVLRSVPLDRLVVRALRRGNTPALPTCLAFNADATLLATASVNGTVHVFANPADQWDALVKQKLLSASSDTPMVSSSSGDVAADTPSSSLFYNALSFIGSVAKNAIDAAAPFVTKDYDVTVSPFAPGTRLVCGWTTGDSPLCIAESCGTLSSYRAGSYAKNVATHVVDMSEYSCPVVSDAPAAAAAAAAAGHGEEHDDEDEDDDDDTILPSLN